jgi:hypothetical protein
MVGDMRRVAFAVGMVLTAAAVSSPARAQDAPPPPFVSASPSSAASAPTASAFSATPPSAVSATPPATAPPAFGIAVVALGGAADAAWPLAQRVYGLASLRPPALDELHARILCGEIPVAGAPQEARDLAESLAAVKGDDAPSRMLLGEIARRLNVRALAVVRVGDGHATARVFLPETGVFDAASYTPDGGPGLAWNATAQSLSRAFGSEVPVGPSSSAPPLATHPEPGLPTPPAKGKAFYESGWFWGALGAAAFAGGAIFFATRDNGESTIHLQVQVPH